jgi:hypothetical protein
VARRSAGVSGLAVFMGATGTYLMYAGIKNKPLIEGLREIMRGERPVNRRAVQRAGERLGGTFGRISDATSEGIDRASDIVINSSRRERGRDRIRDRARTGIPN